MKDFIRSLLVLIIMSLLTGVVYPLAITGIAKVVFLQQAQGSIVKAGNKIVGSAIIGQQFVSEKYFHGRPSALEKPYDAGNSGGSNFGPANAKFLEEIDRRSGGIRNDNGLEPSASIPADLVLASASGFDPHISVEGAMIQVKRVSKARGMTESDVKDLVKRHIEMPFLGFLGEKRINVLKLNLTLDELRRLYSLSDQRG